MTFLLTGMGDDFVEFHAAHTFQFISTTHSIYKTTTLPTTPLSSTTLPTTPLSSKVTQSSDVITTSEKPNVTTPKIYTSDRTLPAESTPSPGNLIQSTLSSATQNTTVLSTSISYSHIPNITKTSAASKVTKPSDRYEPPPGQLAHHLTLSFIITVLVLVTLIVTVATGILLYHFYCKKDTKDMSKDDIKYLNVSQDDPEVPMSPTTSL